MISVSFFLLGGKPTSGGIQIRDVYYYSQQACKFFKTAELPYAVYDSALSAALAVAMLSCQEIARKSRVYSPADFITIFDNETTSESIINAVLRAWTGVLRCSLHHRKCVFQFVLAALEFKKKALYYHALWCDLQAWHACFHRHWHYIQVLSSPISHFRCTCLMTSRLSTSKQSPSSQAQCSAFKRQCIQ